MRKIMVSLGSVLRLPSLCAVSEFVSGSVRFLRLYPDLEQEEINKYQRRTVRVTKEHNADAKRLLRLLGVPVIEVRSVY